MPGAPDVRLVAQWIEHQASNLRVGGSSPSEPAIFLSFVSLLGLNRRRRGNPGAHSCVEPAGPIVDAAMPDWTHEPRIDPVVLATALFGIVTAAVLAAAI